VKEALERISQIPIQAHDAERRYSYICRNCKRPVTLRAGNVRDAYFAHAWGMGYDDCDYYSAAQANPNTNTSNGNSNDTSDAGISLYIKLVRHRENYSWGLELFVSTKDANEGSIFIDVGGHINEIRLSGNTDKFRVVTAAPQTDPYRIVDTQHMLRPLEYLGKACLGLVEQGITVFGDLLKPDAKPVRLAECLRLDCTYAIVWRDTLFYEFPLELSPELMAARDGWCGALLSIPNVLTDDCRQWLIQNLNLEFREASPAILPVWPPLNRAVTSSYLEAPPNQTIAIYVEDGERVRNSALSMPTIFARSAQEVRAAQLDGNDAPFYRLTPESSKTVHLTGRKIDGIEIEMEVDYLLDLTMVRHDMYNSVLLNGVDTHGNVKSIALHNMDSLIWLSEVRGGITKVKSISIPMGAKGAIKVLRNSVWKTELNIAAERSQKIVSPRCLTLDETTVQTIVSIIRDHELSVMVDFSRFGRVQLLSNFKKNGSEASTLSTEILSRIFAYFIQYPNTLPKGMIGSKYSNKELIEKLIKSKPTRESLIVHRTLLAELKKIGIKI
jgi:hypothetical protein